MKKDVKICGVRVITSKKTGNKIPLVSWVEKMEDSPDNVGYEAKTGFGNMNEMQDYLSNINKNVTMIYTYSNGTYTVGGIF